GFNLFIKWVDKHKKEELPISFTMEATGVYHEQLAWFLYERDQIVHIVLANRAKAYFQSIGNKSKNDKIDAKGLAVMGATQPLTIWAPISKQLYELRSITRHLEDLQSIKNALRGQLEQANTSIYSSKEVTRSIKKTMKEIDKQILNAEKMISKCIDIDPVLRQKIEYLTSIKGVGEKTAAVVAAETDGFAQVRNAKQLISYAGYDIKENQSGQRVGKTKITKKGNAHIRRALHFPALNVIRYEVGSFPSLYGRILDRSAIKMKGYVALQARLLRIMFSLWKKEEYYDENYNWQEKSIKKSGSQTLCMNGYTT
ncbi:IS110 family RNA-guided transposase, partial [Flammeovirga pacifica]